MVLGPHTHSKKQGEAEAVTISRETPLFPFSALLIAQGMIMIMPIHVHCPLPFDVVF
jgi:hypothetical protein